MNPWTIGALVALVIIAASARSQAEQLVRLPDGWVSCVVDFAHHQDSARFDWDAAQAAGIRGVVHKLSEGSRMVDGRARVVATECDRRGIAFGGYHFVLPVARATADEQATNATSAADSCGIGPGSRIWLDWERTARWRDSSGEWHEGVVPNWADVLDVAASIRRRGYRVGIYASPSTLTSQRATWDATAAAACGEDCALWLAQWGPQPRPPASWASRVVMWQHRGSSVGLGGDVPGMPGVDRDAVRAEDARSLATIQAVLA